MRSNSDIESAKAGIKGSGLFSVFFDSRHRLGRLHPAKCERTTQGSRVCHAILESPVLLFLSTKDVLGLPAVLLIHQRIASGSLDPKISLVLPPQTTVSLRDGVLSFLCHNTLFVSFPGASISRLPNGVFCETIHGHGARRSFDYVRYCSGAALCALRSAFCILSALSFQSAYCLLLTALPLRAPCSPNLHTRHVCRRLLLLRPWLPGPGSQLTPLDPWAAMEESALGKIPGVGDSWAGLAYQPILPTPLYLPRSQLPPISNPNEDDGRPCRWRSQSGEQAMKMDGDLTLVQ